MFRPYLGGGWVVRVGGWVARVGGKGAYSDLVMTSYHVRVAMGLVAPLLRIGARSGVKHVDGMAHLVCLCYSGCPIGAYEGN